jgi:hypothetical protein
MTDDERAAQVFDRIYRLFWRGLTVLVVYWFVTGAYHKFW